MSDSKSQKSNIKNSNPKIGRPAKTDQEETFKNHYLQNRKKFEIECELLVYIHQNFFEELPTHPTNTRVPVAEMVKLFQKYDCIEIYLTLAKLNELYYKNSSLFPEEKLRYTSIIDLCYLLRQVKVERKSQILNTHQLILILYFFLFNEKVVNQGFNDYFQKRLQIFRNGMINGPNSQLNKLDTLIISLSLEMAIREDIIIEEEVDDDDDQIQDENNEARSELPQKKQGQFISQIKIEKPELEDPHFEQSL